jgi:hypothetical protein
LCPFLVKKRNVIFWEYRVPVPSPGEENIIFWSIQTLTVRTFLVELHKKLLGEPRSTVAKKSTPYLSTWSEDLPGENGYSTVLLRESFSGWEELPLGTLVFFWTLEVAVMYIQYTYLPFLLFKRVEQKKPDIGGTQYLPGWGRGSIPLRIRKQQGSTPYLQYPRYLLGFHPHNPPRPDIIMVLKFKNK